MLSRAPGPSPAGPAGQAAGGGGSPVPQGMGRQRGPGVRLRSSRRKGTPAMHRPSCSRFSGHPACWSNSHPPPARCAFHHRARGQSDITAEGIRLGCCFPRAGETGRTHETHLASHSVISGRGRTSGAHEARRRIIPAREHVIQGGSLRSSRMPGHPLTGAQRGSSRWMMAWFTGHPSQGGSAERSTQERSRRGQDQRSALPNSEHAVWPPRRVTARPSALPASRCIRMRAPTGWGKGSVLPADGARLGRRTSATGSVPGPSRSRPPSP